MTSPTDARKALEAKVAEMLARPGLYVCGDTNHPTKLVPIWVDRGQAHSMELDERLTAHGFLPTFVIYSGPHVAPAFAPVLATAPAEPPKDGEVAALIERGPQRVYQSIFGKNGDCFACCVATLMGVDLSEIPPEVSSAAQFKAIREWALKRGWRVVTLAINEETVKDQLAQGYVIVSGKSSRGLPHAVIFKDGKLWHDPHPSLDGVEVIDEVDLFMPLNPALARLSAPVPDTDVAQDDLREILRVVGLSDCARAYSPHEVVQRELLPHLRALRNVIEKYDGNSNNPYWAEEFNQAVRIARAHLDAPHTAASVPEQNNVPAVEDPHDQIAQLRKRLADAERQGGVRYRHTPKDMVPDRCGNWVAFDPSRLESAAAPVPAREWIPVGERLPEDDRLVAVLDKDGVPAVSRYRNNFWKVCDPVYWTPLPPLPPPPAADK